LKTGCDRNIFAVKCRIVLFEQTDVIMKQLSDFSAVVEHGTAVCSWYTLGTGTSTHVAGQFQPTFF
jgi:hypothetical protein